MTVEQGVLHDSYTAPSPYSTPQVACTTCVAQAWQGTARKKYNMTIWKYQDNFGHIGMI